jgi:hypothetical protein
VRKIKNIDILTKVVTGIGNILQNTVDEKKKMAILNILGSACISL